MEVVGRGRRRGGGSMVVVMAEVVPRGEVGIWVEGEWRWRAWVEGGGVRIGREQRSGVQS